MNLTTVLGLTVGVGALLFSVILEGGHITSLLSLPAFVLVFGGTIGATAIGFSIEELKSVPALLRIAFTEEKHDTNEMILVMVEFAEKARREGLLALEENLIDVEDKFLQKGMQLVIDGTDGELVRHIMETELNSMQERHHKATGIFEAAGGFAPTMGIIGTVMGLVHVLGNLNDTDSLGPAIATAFIATLYGVAIANVFFLPLSAKLKNRSAAEILKHEIALEGILSVQAGDNPRIVKEKLEAFLAPMQRKQILEMKNKEV